MADLQHLRAEYIRHVNSGGARFVLTLPKNEWEPDNIHISELGSCPRATMLRLAGAKKKTRPQGALDNDELMWWIGYQVHYLTYEAVGHAGKMVAYEKSIDGLPDGVTGRCDMLWVDDITPDGRNTLTDIKTVRPNAFKFGELAEDVPRAKPEHILQVGGYLLGDAGGTVDFASVHYVDRGGTNTPITCPVHIESARRVAREALDTLLAHRDNLPELPDPLPEVLKPHFSRAADRHINKVGCMRDWHCNYCDYCGESCMPNGAEYEITLAELNKKGVWEYTPEGKKRVAWIVEQLGSRM